MASILAIGGRWRAQVRKVGHKPITRTFATKAEAVAWARSVEAELDRQPAKSAAGDALTVAAAVDAYRELRRSVGRPIAPEANQHYMLAHLADDLGTLRVQELTPKRLVAWASQRREQGAGPYTVYMELQALGSMLRSVASYRNLLLPDVAGQARPLLRHLQLIGPGNRRARRVLPGELDALCKALPQYADLLTVAALIGLRRGELTRIRWRDLDEVNRAVLVRSRKHPRRTEAKDQWVPLLGATWKIVQRQPRIDERIFPVHPQTLTKAVSNVTRRLGIPDLRLHDLRHEASSRLRDEGFDEIERMAVLGHTRPEQNASYTHVTLPALHAKSAARGSRPRRPRPRKARARPA